MSKKCLGKHNPNVFYSILVPDHCLCLKVKEVVKLAICFRSDGEKKKLAKVPKVIEVETQTEWSWIETMKAIQQQQHLQVTGEE